MPATAPLVLPGGVTVQVVGDERDLSVFAALRTSAGMWEPHVVSLFQQLVGRGSVCLDIGANLGAHTLALATLCPGGRVVAFEAGSVNAAFLRQNVALLPPTAGAVQVERLALWDELRELHLAMFDELAGCAFLSERGPEADEQLIRAVVDSPQVQATPLGVTSDPVTAVRLDDWFPAHGPARLDLVKIDVEGAETRVLAGATGVLRRHRPALVTEYNPSCATTYWGQGAGDYFAVLQDLFDDVRVVQAQGGLSAPLTSWAHLEDQLGSGRGWEDLLCTYVDAPQRGWRRWLSRR